MTFPYSAPPLLLLLRGARPRPVAAVVALAATAQLALVVAAGGAWGLELGYVPIILLALLLLCLPPPPPVRRPERPAPPAARERR